MKLIFHPASPFARMCYIVALERPPLADRIHLHQVVVAPVRYEGWSTDNELVGRHNPIGKIPCLLLDETDSQGNQHAIFDSRVILEYLDTFGPQEYQLDAASEASKKPFFVSKTILAAVNGILDAEILVVYEEKLRGEKGIKYEEWIEGMRAKEFRGFDFLEKAVKNGDLRLRTQDQSVSTCEAAAAVALAFFDARRVDWRTGRDALVDWSEKAWRNRESFVRTDPKKDWKAVAFKTGNL